ncbi:MAG: creatininase family protein [Anaerolineales bacterium]
MTPKKVYDWQNSSWDLRECPPHLALLPMGATEQFGPHLPLATQNLLLKAISRRVADALSNSVYLLPPIPVGSSGQHQGFAGTVSLSWRTLMAVLSDLGESLLQTGTTRLAVLVGLGGAACSTTMPRENQIVKTAVRRLNYDHEELDAIWVQPLTVAHPPLDTLFDGPQDDVHAGQVVTSLMLHLHPDLVKALPDPHIPPAGSEEYLHQLPFSALCPDGVWGRPDLADAERGREALQAAVAGTTAYIEETFVDLARLRNKRARGFQKPLGSLHL